jgi:hypothetical protein
VNNTHIKGEAKLINLVHRERETNMVLLGLTKFSVLSLCFLVLATFPYQVSSHGSFGRKPNGAYPPLDDGICATSVIVHGYKCQELQVI